MANKLFFYCKDYGRLGNGLEEETILEMIARHSNAVAINLYPQLASGPNHKLNSDMRGWLNNGQCFWLPSATIEHIQFWMKGWIPAESITWLKDVAEEDITALSPESVLGRLPVILQVAAQLGHRPNHYDKWVATYAKDGIPGLCELISKGAIDKQDIEYLLLRDHLARGCNMADEDTAVLVHRDLRSREEGRYSLCECQFDNPCIYKIDGASRVAIDHIVLERTLNGSPIPIFISPDSTTAEHYVLSARILMPPQYQFHADSMAVPGYELVKTYRDQPTNMYVNIVRHRNDSGFPPIQPLDLLRTIIRGPFT